MAYFPGSGAALTLSEGALKLSYCYECKDCGFRERVNLTRVAADYPPQTQIGDLLTRLPCGRCGATEKIVMMLWLNASTTSNMLRAHGYPVWEEDG